MRFLVNCHRRKYSQRIRSPDPNQASDSGAIMSWKWNRHLCLSQVFWGLMGFLLTGLYALWVLEKVSPRDSSDIFTFLWTQVLIALVHLDHPAVSGVWPAYEVPLVYLSSSGIFMEGIRWLRQRLTSKLCVFLFADDKLLFRERQQATPHQTGLGSLVNSNKKKRSACSGDVEEGWGRQWNGGWDGRPVSSISSNVGDVVERRGNELGKALHWQGDLPPKALTPLYSHELGGCGQMNVIADAKL